MIRIYYINKFNSEVFTEANLRTKRNMIIFSSRYIVCKHREVGYDSIS